MSDNNGIFMPLSQDLGVSENMMEALTQLEQTSEEELANYLGGMMDPNVDPLVTAAMGQMVIHCIIAGRPCSLAELEWMHRLAMISGRLQHLAQIADQYYAENKSLKEKKK